MTYLRKPRRVGKEREKKEKRKRKEKLIFLSFSTQMSPHPFSNFSVSMVTDSQPASLAKGGDEIIRKERTEFMKSLHSLCSFFCYFFFFFFIQAPLQSRCPLDDQCHTEQSM
jgi:hypothetical protein